MTIIAPGLRYEITPDDKLWAGRMLVGESGTDKQDGAAVLWTMTQRFTLGNWPTLTALFRSYSQPINPRWAASGEFCRDGGRYHGRPECSPERLARRARTSSIAWEALPASIRELVDAWADGALPNPVPRAVEFADPAVTAAFVRRPSNAGAVYVKRIKNHFVATARSKQWAPDRVRIEGSAGLSGIGAVFGVGWVFAAFIALAIVWVLR